MHYSFLFFFSQSVSQSVSQSQLPVVGTGLPNWSLCRHLTPAASQYRQLWWVWCWQSLMSSSVPAHTTLSITKSDPALVK